MRLAIMGLTADERRAVREAVREAVRQWPNAHLGDTSPGEDMRGAFRIIRARVIQARGDILSAAAHVMDDALRHEDM